MRMRHRWLIPGWKMEKKILPILSQFPVYLFFNEYFFRTIFQWFFRGLLSTFLMTIFSVTISIKCSQSHNGTRVRKKSTFNVENVENVEKCRMSIDIDIDFEKKNRHRHWSTLILKVFFELWMGLPFYFKINF